MNCIKKGIASIFSVYGDRLQSRTQLSYAKSLPARCHLDRSGEVASIYREKATLKLKRFGDVCKTSVMILAVVLFCSAQLSADEAANRSILQQQARHYSAQRNYEQADEIYKELLQSEPTDYKTAENYIRNLMAQQKFAEAQAAMQLYGESMPPIVGMRMRLQLMLLEGEDAAASEQVDLFLKNNPNRMNYYTELSRVYEAYKRFDAALDLLVRARTLAGDDVIYAYQMGNIYFSAQEYSQAVAEYFKHLARQSGYLHFVYSRCKTMLDADPTIIDVIYKQRLLYDAPQCVEAVAQCLAYAHRMQQALELYETLEPQKLFNFAQSQQREGNHAVALQAFERYEERIHEPTKRAQTAIHIAELLLSTDNLAAAETRLQEIRAWKEIQAGNLRYRTQANYQCRQLLAELTLRQGGDVTVAVEYLQEAMQFVYNQKQRRELELQVIHLRILAGQYDAAEQELQRLQADEDPGTEIYKAAFGEAFLLNMFRGDDDTDSLLVELVVNIPQDAMVNDALALAIYLEKLPPEVRDAFLAAWRLRELYRYNDALIALLPVIAQPDTEAPRLMAAQWAMQLNKREQALQLLDYQFEDTSFGDYAVVLRAAVTADAGFINQELNERSTSVFAPFLRRLLQ